LFGGADGITLPNPDHVAHFEDEQHFTENFLPLNTAVATQLTLLPLPSPASGFTYELNRESGLRIPRAQTLGPILTERGETLGARRLFAGFAYQRFHFDKLDGSSLDSLPTFFTHTPDTGPGGTPQAYELDVITTTTSVDLKIDQFTMFGSFGLTDRFDISAAVPLMRVGLHASSFAKINRISNELCGTDPCHYFDPANKVGSTTHTYTNSGTATGIGDVTLRFKQNAYNNSKFSLALLADLRLPTGDAHDFLGSGAIGVKPFVAVSLKKEVFAPHFNIGYEWNGESVLAGNLTTGEKKSLPKQFFYSFGTEIKLAQSLTATTDLVGQRLFDGTRIQQEQLSASGSLWPTLSFPKEDFGINNGSIGLKYTLANRLLVTANALVSIDKGGLRQRLTPLVGFSYLF